MSEKNFEEALADLERLTSELEEGDLSLEESLKKFEEGVKLSHFCNRKLEEAQKRISLLLKKDGEFTAMPFSAPETNENPE